MQAQISSNSSVTQRWERPEIFDFEPGHWKKQLAGKYLSVAAKGDVKALRTLLQEHPEFLNKGGPHNRTLLWEATRNGRTEAVVPDLEHMRYLLDHGAPANRTGKNGFPPLIYIARGDKGEHPDKLQVLLDYGADVNAAGPNGRTALHALPERPLSSSC